MFYIHATRKLLNTSNINPVSAIVPISEPSLNNWYADLLSSTFRGKHFILFVHEPSLLCILAQGKSIRLAFPDFLNRLKSLLDRFDFPVDFISNQLTQPADFVVLKTDSRSILAKINGMKRHFRAHFFRADSPENINLDKQEDIMMEFLCLFEKKYRSPHDYWSKFFEIKPGRIFIR